MKNSHNLEMWNEVVGRMSVLMRTLGSSDLLGRDKLQAVPECGVYVFYEAQTALYVGRSDRMRERIQEHGRDGSKHSSASFAFLLATDEARRQGIDCGLPRAVLEQHADFVPVFRRAKARVRKMKVRVVETSNDIEQAIFEIYAALSLQTTREQGGYNDFENH